MRKFLYINFFILISLLNAEQVQSIKFTNLSMISNSVANDILGFEIGEEVNDNQINKALKAFYKFGYFDDIVINNINGEINFTFKEKPIIAKIDMNGYKTRENELKALYRKIGISKGTMYSKSKIKKIKNNLLKELETEGYIYSVVEVDIKNINNDAVYVIFNVNKGDEIVIQKVNYFGLENLSQGDLESVTANKEIEYFSWFFGRNDGEVKINQLQYESRRIQDLYFQNGYLDSKVDDPFMRVNFANNSALLDFFILEGEQYSINSIDIKIDKEIIDKTLLYDKLKLKIDKTFDISKLRIDVEFIKTQISNLGYAFTQINYDIKQNKHNATADIVFNVKTGNKVYINDVLISGNDRTLDRVIRRNVYLSPGDIFNLTDFKDSKNKLQRLGYFENVTIEQKRISADKMDLLVNVKETSTGNIIVGGGYGSYDGLILNAKINEKNIFGSGKTVAFSVDKSDRKINFRISYKDPAINDSTYSGYMEVHTTDTEIQYYNPSYTLDKQTFGFSLGTGKEWLRNLHAGIRYNHDTIEEKYDNYDTTDTQYVALNNKDDNYTSNSITPYIKFDNTDNYFFPKNGVKTGSSFQYAGLGGDAKYVKVNSYFKYFYSLENILDKDWTIRYRAKVGVLIDNGKITKGDSFYLGGVSSVRGYQSYSFGPELNKDELALKRMFTNSIELSFPLIKSAKMRWGLFYDYGMIGNNNFGDTKRSGAGALIEWISPVGPIQFIFAEPINPQDGDKTSSFEFSLGARF